MARLKYFALNDLSSSIGYDVIYFERGCKNSCTGNEVSVRGFSMSFSASNRISNMLDIWQTNDHGIIHLDIVSMGYGSNYKLNNFPLN